MAQGASSQTAFRRRRSGVARRCWALIAVVALATSMVTAQPALADDATPVESSTSSATPPVDPAAPVDTADAGGSAVADPPAAPTSAAPPADAPDGSTVPTATGPTTNGPTSNGPTTTEAAPESAAAATGTAASSVAQAGRAFSVSPVTGQPNPLAGLQGFGVLVEKD